ncbi:MAG: acetyl-CoA carboxylase biotin carboxylase subunit [Myxococcales bacterium]|nr:acetyl-CoA carboxylase biotin carboxylase subunit [Myxococcales bacterium]
MFRRVLIANRGEIACRVIRSLRELGISPVAVASEADARAKHVRLADQVVILGPAASRESYLRADRIIDACKQTGAEAIHPGYGFLSESEVLRDACDAAGIVFIGPTSAAMAAMGNKTRARGVMQAAGVPIVPGATRAAKDGADVTAMAREVGFPVLLKAAAGGGGKGMRLVERESELVAAFESCSREAASAFGDGSVYVERAIIRPRHIEIQVFADKHGHAVYCFERECSVQRRHQKVIEEAPAANLSDATRRAMGAVAVKAALAIGYEGAGTIEFLVDADENFYFLEMNTRLQVEHPVTEMITGLDLVKLQVMVAAGRPLPFVQEQLVRRGHAIECRLYAEDPYQNFMPSPGPLRRYRPPTGPGVRVDDGVEEGDVVSRFYDPMVAKIAVWGDDRDAAIAKMHAALSELRVAGIRTNRAFLQELLSHPEFVAGRYSTALIGSMGALVAKAPSSADEDQAAALAAILAHRQEKSKKPSAVAPSSDRGWSVTARADALRRW